MITEIEDIQGKPLNVGDHVAWGETTSTSNAVICHGEIVSIIKKPFQTHIKVKIIKEGGYALLKGGYWSAIDQIRTFIYPRNYHNIIKL